MHSSVSSSRRAGTPASQAKRAVGVQRRHGIRVVVCDASSSTVRPHVFNPRQLRCRSATVLGSRSCHIHPSDTTSDLSHRTPPLHNSLVVGRMIAYWQLVMAVSLRNAQHMSPRG